MGCSGKLPQPEGNFHRFCEVDKSDKCLVKMDHRKRNAGSDQTHSSLQEPLLFGPINQMDTHEGPETKFILIVGLCHSDHGQQELKKRSDE